MFFKTWAKKKPQHIFILPYYNSFYTESVSLWNLKRGKYSKNSIIGEYHKLIFTYINSLGISAQDFGVFEWQFNQKNCYIITPSNQTKKQLEQKTWLNGVVKKYADLKIPIKVIYSIKMDENNPASEAQSILVFKNADDALKFKISY